MDALLCVIKPPDTEKLFPHFVYHLYVVGVFMPLAFNIKKFEIGNNTVHYTSQIHYVRVSERRARRARRIEITGSVSALLCGYAEEQMGALKPDMILLDF